MSSSSAEEKEEEQDDSTQEAFEESDLTAQNLTEKDADLSLENDSRSNFDTEKEAEIDEEAVLKSKLEEVDFGTRLKINAKLAYNNRKSEELSKNNKGVGKGNIKEEMRRINKGKLKSEPKEFSAVLKPKQQFKYREINKEKSSFLNKKMGRDPRFDDLSGTLNEERFNNNYKFVKDLAEEYMAKLDKVRKSAKMKKKLSEEQYVLLKKQNNYMKSWMNKQNQMEKRSKIKQELKRENREREERGQKKYMWKKAK